MQSRKIDLIKKYIGEDTMYDIDSFAEESINRKYKVFNTEDEINDVFNKFIKSFYNEHSIMEISDIRYYTGIAFNNINALLRDKWDYEKNGALTDKKEQEIYELSDSLGEIIGSVTTLPTNIKTYRGVSLNNFNEYGIYSLNDLKKLKGQYYYESGFTSTSLLRNKSFFDRELEWHDRCNIEIEYLIPEESGDGIPLITDDLSYSKSQNEFLLNKGCLSKIVDVSFDEDMTKGYIKEIVIPKKMWNKDIFYSKTKKM